MRVGEIGRRDVVTVAPDATVADITDTMYHQQVGSVVITDGEELAGILTDRDLVIELFAEDSERNLFDGEVPLEAVTAKDLMTTDPLTVSPNDELPTAIAQMNDAITRRLPIVEDGRVVGIVTLDDLLVHLAGEYRRLSADMEGITDVIRDEFPTT